MSVFIRRVKLRVELLKNHLKWFMLSGHVIGEMFFMHQTGGDPGGDTVLAWELFDIPIEELEEIKSGHCYQLLPTQTEHR